MRIYIWNDLDKLTNRCHSGGGAVAIAPDIEAARAAILGCSGVIHDSDVAIAAPTYEAEAVTDVPCAYIFPDSGCC